MDEVNINGTLSTPLANTTTANVTQTPGFPEYLHQPLGALVFQISLWSTIVFLGVVGNLLVCFVILSQAKMKTSMNYFLLSLAIADLGVLLILYPMMLLKYLYPFHWLLGKHACYYLYPTVEIFFGASIWSITAIAIERYRNIVGAKRYRIKRSSRVKTSAAIFVVWLASFLVSSVPLYPFMAYNPTQEICGPELPEAVFLSYSIALIVVWYALPLVVIAFTYVRIKNRVRESVKFRTSMSLNDDGDQAIMPPASSNRKRSERKIWRQSGSKTKRILTPLVILFAVTMFPLNAFRVVVLIIPGYSEKSYYNLLLGQLIMFIMINSSANPLVYYIMSKEFKDVFKKIFTSLKDKKNFFKQFSGKTKYSWRISPSGLEAASDDKEENRGGANKSSNEPQALLANGNVQIVTGI